MSRNSHHARPSIRQVENVSQQEYTPQRNGSHTRRRAVVTKDDAYLAALKVAYLHYLLQPRAKRLKHVEAPRAVQRAGTTVTDLVKDISLNSKSTKFPHKFMDALDKRMTDVLIGREKMPEYNDATIKRTFAVFLNEFKNPAFRKSMEKDRNVEGLLLIFFSSATKELQKGKPPDDDGWKLMVDRHVALFIRLISATLKSNEWARDRPELTSRLATMEKKLLVHDQDLSAKAGSSTIEVEVPRSYEVKDMPLVLLVARIFMRDPSEAQADVRAYKEVWTEKAALQDLKTYQMNLTLGNRRTLNSDDFEVEDAYESWKKEENRELSQMLLSIMQSNPELAKSTGSNIPQIKAAASASSSDSAYPNPSRNSESISSNTMQSYVFDQPVDMSALNLGSPIHDEESFYTFIPQDPRAYYRVILKEALSYDLQTQELQPTEEDPDGPSITFFRESLGLLNEISLRWRLPQFSRAVLFLDVVKEKYQHQEVDLPILDAAFNYAKLPPTDGKKGSRSSQMPMTALFDRSRWTVTDYVLNRNILSSLHDSLLREFFETMLLCYDTKPPPLGPIMWILETHIYKDDLFDTSSERLLGLDQFSNQMHVALKSRASEVYRTLLAKEIPNEKEKWEFYHVIQLGKAVVKITRRMQKRYRNKVQLMRELEDSQNPSQVLLEVNPSEILVEEILPSYAADARDLVSRIMDVAHQKGEPVPVQDGFDLYKELVEIRKAYSEVLPGRQFDFSIEGDLQEFVWRWIEMTDANLVGWVENAFKGDDFQVRTSHPDNIPTDDERHSNSVIDIFRSFNQSIEQIINLNWDDDLQYAKFMTALSKSIGAGISRYCELVEKKFTLEMDRLTPEQEAEQAMTRQEKWLQMAKESWTNEKKLEPFNFLPESLVKLNNMEYAVMQLDKLEHEINVDACAEVIHRNTVQQRVQATNKYVFTIKILEAEDLKACDMNGLSDPYVVLGDEYQKRLAKTRVIYSNLNPRWDETVDITASGPLNIIATIWDWDTLGDHDCVGRTSLKLDPSHFRDYLPREYWLDLDTQGRLLLRVSMEGERDDIQFYFGKAFRMLKRTERDMTRKVTDKLSAYINHNLSRRALKALLSRGLTMSSVAGFFQRNRPQSVVQAPTKAEVEAALDPLFTYFNDNFALMKQTLTDAAMVMVMSRLWKETLATIESLLVPSLSDKPSQQRPLTQQEVDIVFKWLALLFNFFHAVDEDTGESGGVPLDVLKSPKYHELQSLNFFYFDSTENLIRTSESIASDSAARRQAEQSRQRNNLSIPGAGGAVPFGGAGGLMGTPTRKYKTIMLSRNLGTMRKAKEEKRIQAQAESNDDYILRILRMRPEAERYLKERSRQKVRLAAQQEANSIVQRSLQQGASRMVR